MELIVAALLNIAIWGDARYQCAIGRSGVTREKREGDGATPLGKFAFREVYYRPDRVERPITDLPVVEITPQSGWSDDPSMPEYNRPVQLPYAGSHEKMWRDDHLYDLVIVVGHNDDPPIPDRGSAIFIHVASPGYKPTAGCIAFAKEDLLQIINTATPASRLVVSTNQ